MKSRARQLLDKSVQATVAAIELYNKPSFSYRDEAFAILAINGWELLLKSRILLLDGNRVNSIVEYGYRQLLDGSRSAKQYRRKSRSGNYVSIGLLKAFDRLRDSYGDTISENVRKNLVALVEIRDNAIHFMNKDFNLRKRVHEIGTASLKNYLNLTRLWFGATLEEYELFLMPMAFLRGVHSAEAIVMNNEERNVLKYIESIEDTIDDDGDADFNFTLDVAIKFRRTPDPNATLVRLSNSPNAVAVTLGEADIRDKYPWSYNILTTRLRARYSDFLANQKYHEVRRPLEIDPKFCNSRYLDPGNPKSARKNFYNPNILSIFDKYYTKKSKKSS